MSLLDDLQRLYDEYMDEDNEKADEAAAHYAELHPRIVAALVAANRLAERWPLECNGADDLRTFCAVCDQDISQGCAEDCPGQALVAALQA